MPTVCIHCTLESFVKSGGQIATFAPVFDETPEEHMARVHPVPPTPAERAELERKAAEIVRRGDD